MVFTGVAAYSPVYLGRKYDFLAFGNSQLREHSVWFFASTEANNDGSDSPPVNAQSIRDGMGDFSSIRVVAKRAARMGQCFSDTVGTGIEV